jgi:hypothetical protein
MPKLKRTLLKEILLSEFGTIEKDKLNNCINHIMELFKRKSKNGIQIDKDSISDPFALSVIKSQENKVGQELSLPQVVIEYYKSLQNLDNVPKWNELNFKKYCSIATELLNTLGVELFRIIQWFSKTPYKWNLFSIKYNYQWYYQRGVYKESSENEKATRTLEKYRH